MKKSLLFPILVCIFPMLSACNEHFVAGLAEGMARGLNKKATSTSEIVTQMADGTVCRTARSNRSIHCSDGTTYRLSRDGKRVWGSDGTNFRISRSGRSMSSSDGTIFRISRSGRSIYGSDGTYCRTSRSGRITRCN